MLVCDSAPPAVIALSETWLDDSVFDSEVSLPSYRLLRHDRDRRGGGVAIYVSDSISIHSVSRCSSSELLSVELVTKSGLLLLAVLYRPPNLDTDFSLLDSAITTLNISNSSNTIIVGDFNIDLLASSSSAAADLLSLMSGFGLHQLVTSPTRVTSNSSSLIDHVYCSNHHLVDCLSVSSELGSSDHCSLSVHLSTCKPVLPSIRRRIWLYQQTDFDALNSALEDSLPPEDILTGGDVNNTWSLFKTAFLDTMHRFIPSKFISCKKSLPPWLTGEVTPRLERAMIILLCGTESNALARSRNTQKEL